MKVFEVKTYHNYTHGLVKLFPTRLAAKKYKTKLVKAARLLEMYLIVDIIERKIK